MQLKDNGGSDFAIAPAGVHMAVCYQVIDLGIRHNATYNNYQRKLRIAWELVNEKMDDGRPFSVSATYTASLSSKANLRRDLEAWRGRAFTDDELAGFSPKGMIAAPCQVSVVHNESGGTTYANVNSIMPLPKGMEKPIPVNDTLYFSWDDTRDQYSALPDWIREKAMGEDPAIHMAPQAQQPAQDFNTAMDSARGGDDFDDITFAAYQRGEVV